MGEAYLDTSGDN